MWYAASSDTVAMSATRSSSASAFMCASKVSRLRCRTGSVSVARRTWTVFHVSCWSITGTVASVRSGERDRDARVAAHGARVGPFDPRFVDVPGGPAFERLFERDPTLEARQRRADAVVRAVPE